MQNFSHKKTSLPNCSITAFLSKKHCRHNTEASPQSVSYAQVTSPAKFLEKNLKLKVLMLNQLTFKNKLSYQTNLIKHNEETIEPYRANNSELSDIKFLKKFLHGYHAAYFPCKNLQLTLEAMHHSSYELHSAVTLLKQVSIFNFFAKI